MIVEARESAIAAGGLTGPALPQGMMEKARRYNFPQFAESTSISEVP
jgi:hypothetical protein